MQLPPRRLIEWQRMLSPEQFNKAGGAKYHTAPSLVFPGSPDFPDGVPNDSVTIMFRLTDDMMLRKPQHVIVKDPFIAEKPVKRGRKSAPIVMMDESSVLAVVPVSANYYWSAKMLATHKTVRLELRPDKDISDKERIRGKKRGITVIATFIPNAGEP